MSGTIEGEQLLSQQQHQQQRQQQPSQEHIATQQQQQQRREENTSAQALSCDDGGPVAPDPPYPLDAAPPDYPPPPYPGREGDDMCPVQAPAYPGPPIDNGRQVPMYFGQAPSYIAPNQPYPPQDKMGVFAGFAAPPPGHQPVRGEYQDAGTIVVTTQPVGGTVPTVVRTPKPNNWLALSVLTCMCFSPLFGLIAICFSVMSDSAYHIGDMEGSRRNANTALGLSVTGIVISTIIMAIMVFKVM